MIDNRFYYKLLLLLLLDKEGTVRTARGTLEKKTGKEQTKKEMKEKEESPPKKQVLDPKTTILPTPRPTDRTTLSNSEPIQLSFPERHFQAFLPERNLSPRLRETKARSSLEKEEGGRRWAALCGSFLW